MLAALLTRHEIAIADGCELTALLGEPRPRHLLAVAGIADGLRGELEGYGCLTGTVPCVAGALMVLRGRDFDSVIVHPETEGGLGLRMVRALKLGGRFPGLSEQFLEPLRRALAAKAFWIAPLPGSDDYGLVLANGCVALRSQSQLRLAEGICRLKAFERPQTARA